MKKKNYGARYPNGYAGKIGYYQAKLSIAVNELSLGDIKFFTAKLEYFMDKQIELDICNAKAMARLADLID